MTSSRPYIMRALNEWILDNGCTPHVLVNAMADDTLVPQEYVKNGQITLNISPTAVTELVLSDEVMQFNGRFSGVPMEVYVPMAAVMGIYARENGQGMMFDIEEPEPEPNLNAPVSLHSKKNKKSNKPSLKVVK
jgi:stringent starvation protein B